MAFLPEARFTVPRSEGDLVYYRYGPAHNKSDGKFLLAIHGITASNRAWQFFARTMCLKHGYTVYAVDLRGRGDSSKLPGPFGFRIHALDMLAVLDHLSLEQCDVVGHSMGAFVAVAMLGIAPERVAKVGLIDGGLPLALPPGHSLASAMPLILGPALARLSMKFDSTEAYADFFKPQQAFIKGWGAELDEYVAYDLEKAAPRANPDAVMQDSEDLFASDLIDQTLKALPKEVLLLRAERGLQNEPRPLYPLETLTETLSSYSLVKLVTVDDVNHYDILMHQDGADRCIGYIYPELR